MTFAEDRVMGSSARGGVLLVWLVLASACAGTGPTGGGSAVPEGGSPEVERSRVILLHDNDTHLHDNHRDEVRRFVEGVRGAAPSVFLVSGGDVLVRHSHLWPEGEGIEWYRREGLRQIEWMNELEYDVMVSGNHELEPHEMVTREILDAARFPILAANIRIETEQLPRHPAYHILTTEDGLTLAVLGLSVINFEAPPGLVEEGYHQTVEAHRALAEEHDALILLNHIGIRYDLELANAFPEVAAIIGGHTHTLLPEAIHVNGVLVAQTGGHHHVRNPESEMTMGVVVLEFEDGELVESCGWVVSIGPQGVRPAGAYRYHAERWEAPVPACAA
ncbi:MAG: hypothetical protein EA351_00180 [Gemmatimonadales bacterium]|nr:MAG: hypothetical protein EA351_00180 [Gemmatimonadales bacterium]